MTNTQHTNGQKIWGTLLIVVALTMYAMPFVIGEPCSVFAFVVPGTLPLVFGVLMLAGRMPSPQAARPSPIAQQRAARIGGYALLVVGLAMIALPWIIGVPDARIAFVLAGSVQMAFGGLMVVTSILTKQR